NRSTAEYALISDPDICAHIIDKHAVQLYGHAQCFRCARQRLFVDPSIHDQAISVIDMCGLDDPYRIVHVVPLQICVAVHRLAEEGVKTLPDSPACEHQTMLFRVSERTVARAIQDCQHALEGFHWAAFFSNAWKTSLPPLLAMSN